MHHFAPHRFTRNGTDTLTNEKSPLNRYSSRTIFEADSRTEVAQTPSNTRKRSRTSVTISAGAFASKTARRTCQSRFFTWSARTAPPMLPPRRQKHLERIALDVTCDWTAIANRAFAL